jgi:uncharacterized protein (DUF2126 family)/transglutaminase-like putative cysteine protease
MIRVALRHSTRYAYDRPVRFDPHVVRLRPAAHCRTPIQSYSVRVAPDPHFLNWQQDPFGNFLARLVFPEPARELCIDVDLVAELVTINPFDFFLEPYAEKYPFQYEPSLARDLLPYLEANLRGPRLEAVARGLSDSVARPGRRTVDLLVEVNQLIQRSLHYDIRMEPGVFTPEETLERRHGSCRDFAWLLVHLLRQLGFAARFVSGYSIQLTPDQKPLSGPAGVAQDVADLHAWAEVYLPGAGWVGLDATSGLICGEGHIPLACTAEPTAAAPVTGGYRWEKLDDDDEILEDFSFEMRVTRIEDRPRPTRSYTDQQWQQILEGGDRVERELIAADVRLTMGGEPTFVSVDDMESPEWNTTALGPTKAILADKLVRRLLARFAPGGVLHHGQGKWYPGEPLPRWAYGCFFRKDGEPIWNDPALFAEGRGTGARHGQEDALALARTLGETLGVQTDHIEPAYEDAWYYVWRERRLPVNVDPFDSKLEDEQERARLSRIFTQGLTQVVGYALPIRAYDAPDGHVQWVSAPWFLRDERLFLVPGDSPMGYRLPLDSLPWSAPDDVVWDPERDLFAPQPKLPTRAALLQRKGGPSSDRPPALGAQGEPARGASAAEVVRTALCIEPRDGVLHVFLPPLALLEHYLDLVAHIEQAAEEHGFTLRLEGYEPPPDPRIERLKVTPDPGVIEVNIHPSANWRHAVQTTTTLYEEARQVGLGTDKYMLDGRHTGTGGGNHVVLGAARPEDSPLLRRPDLLRSLIAFWNNHPALSYVFSGQFVGPTSQAPRVDEARHDTLYELEVAFQALQGRDAPAPPPWLVDRLFRHLLVDVTGNTHRTEMCIDKLYDPATPAGRQGLLELRAFEMPPDARMSAAQQLLVRSVVAAFWKRPYTRSLVRWGTALHDRYLLPHFAWQDLGDALEDLAQSGYELDPAWFLPHWEFRFPRLGTAAALGIELELRNAIEPWHVLGEEAAAGGQARYVDSSVERVQLLVRGMTDERHRVVCNGVEVPLHPTGRVGEFVAGVRFKAWKPPSSLHPTLDIDSPLVFDVYDSWMERAVGGCSYHVAHPGGRHYDVYPKNGLEAESRRMSRFFPFGHSPGHYAPKASPPTRDLPVTLDLRRFV